MHDFSTMKRMKEIAGVLFDYELHHIISYLSLKKHLSFHKRFEPSVPLATINPENLREIFEKLGGAFIKLGQLFALRPDLIGKEYSKEFEKLLSDLSPENPIVIESLVKHIPFKKFSEKPLGSASIAQVHKAILKGKTVAVKIKRPKIADKINQDIKIMEIIAKRIKDKYNPTYIDPVEIIEEFKRYTEKELDFRHEAANIRRFAANFKNNCNIRIPKVLQEYSNEDILIMEYLEGKDILSMKGKPRGIIKKFTNIVYKMLFEDRFFHADLHPGNVHVNDDKIVLLDYGIVGYIDKELEKKLFHLFSALVNADIEKTTNALLDINISKQEPNIEVLKEGLHDVLGDYYDQPIGKFDFKKIFYGAIDVAKKSKIKIPAQLVLFGKSLVTMEGFCKQVEPDFNIIADAKIYVNKFIRKKLSAKNIAYESKDIAFQAYEMISSLPETIKAISRKFQLVEQRIIDSDITFKKLSEVIWSTAKLLSLTLIFATLMISAVLLKDTPPLFKEYSILSIALLAFNIFILFEVIKIAYNDKFKDKQQI